MTARRHRPASLWQALPGLGRVGRALKPYLLGQSGLAVGAVLTLIGATVMRLLEPWPLKFIVDDVLGAAPAPTGTGSSDLGPGTLLALCVAALITVLGLRALLSYFATVLMALAGQRALTSLRRDLFGHLQRLSPNFHQGSSAGDLTLRLVGDVGMLRDTLVTAAMPLLANMFAVTGMLAAMFWINWQLALVALLPLPLLALGSRRVGRRIQEVARTQRKREGAMAAVAAEALSAIRLVQALSLHARTGEVFGAASQRSMKDGARAARLSAGLERGTDGLVALATAGVLGFGALQVLQGRLTLGELLVFLTYLKNTMRPVREYAKYTARLAKASAAGERVVDLLEVQPEVTDAPRALQAAALDGEVRFEDVRFSYGDDPTPALDGLDLSVRAGELLAVTGPSGAGKSTLATLLLRLHDPQHGRITIGARDLREFTVDSLRRHIACVPQDSALFTGTIAHNIALGATGTVSQHEIEAAARLAHAHDFIAELTDGYETQVGERGGGLSGGQRQRIAMARAILRRGSLLVLDEPTAALDGDSERAVTHALWQLARERTTVLITHDLDLAARADRIAFMDRGRILELDTHVRLLARRGHYARLYELQRGAAVPRERAA